MTRYASAWPIKLPPPRGAGPQARRVPQQLIAEVPKSHPSGSSPSQERRRQMMDVQVEGDLVFAAYDGSELALGI
jgi:hypothetical protein